MARLRDLPAGQRVVTRSGFPGTVVGRGRLGDICVVLVDLDLLTGQPRNPVVVFPENLNVTGEPSLQPVGALARKVNQS